MSTSQPHPDPLTPTGLSRYDDEPVSGWMFFAGTVLGLAGLMRLLDSIWAFRYNGALPDELSDGLLGDKLTTYAWVWLKRWIATARPSLCRRSSTARRQCGQTP